MRPIFNFRLIETKLHKPTRSLIISLLPNEQKKIFASLEQLFELESALAWAYDKLEIDSILLQSQGDFFHHGIDWENVKDRDRTSWMKMIGRVRTIQKLIMRLPQTVVCDLNNGVSHVGFDLALACDFRIASKQFKCIYDNQQKGIPSFTTLDFMQVILGTAFTQQFLYGRSYFAGEWHQKNFLSELYDESNRDEMLFQLLNVIHQQHSVVRIQQKLAMTESIMQLIEPQEEKQLSILNAALSAEEWKKGERTWNENEKYPGNGARNFKRQVRLFLVPNLEKEPN
ncbi:MAG: enoyl-CoA hydratase-related protein [Bacteriovoracaceae bacterium]|nr:enoyl-CoA hydratase-related protein [Bacteriovoracaceae bacterium]